MGLHVGDEGYKNEESIQVTSLHQNNVFFLMNTPGAMQNIDWEPSFCTQFAKQKVCPILYIIVF